MLVKKAIVLNIVFNLNMLRNLFVNIKEIEHLLIW